MTTLNVISFIITMSLCLPLIAYVWAHLQYESDIIVLSEKTACFVHPLTWVDSGTIDSCPQDHTCIDQGCPWHYVEPVIKENVDGSIEVINP